MSTGDTSGDRNGGRGRGARRWLGLALAASVALNAFFLAKTFGASLHGPGAKHDRRGGPMRSFLREAPELRETARAIRRERRPAHRRARQELMAARTAFQETLLREPFDLAAIEAAQARIGEARAAMGAVRHEALRALVSEMTPEQRAAFAQHLAERQARRAERRRQREEREAQEAR